MLEMIVTRPSRNAIGSCLRKKTRIYNVAQSIMALPKTMHFFTFCVDIGRHSRTALERCLMLLVKSIHKHVPKYKVICFTNFALENAALCHYNVEVREYHTPGTALPYTSGWHNLSFNKINVYKALRDEQGRDYTWIDLDTIIAADISYINDLSNVFIEHGGEFLTQPNVLINDTDIAWPQNRCIQGNIWKLDLHSYDELMKTYATARERRMQFKYDLQDLFTFWIYIERNGDLSRVNILGRNVYQHTMNGLAVWSGTERVHPNVGGLTKLSSGDDGRLTSAYHPDHEIHILSFTFFTIIELWEHEQFSLLFQVPDIAAGPVNMYCLPGRNFGDAVAKRFWHSITDGRPLFYDQHAPHYFTMGSIICLARRQSILLGCGFISESGDLGGGDFESTRSKVVTRPSSVIAVRGPLTRRKLLSHGVQCPSTFADPLILMPCVYGKCEPVTERIVGIIPHYIDKECSGVAELRASLEGAGYRVNIIDIETGENYEQFIDEISACQHIVSSSLHGVVMGIVYHKRTCFVEFSDKVVGKRFKFRDFLLTIGITLNYRHRLDSTVLDDHFRVDNRKLVTLGCKFIQTIPFIDYSRRCELLDKYVAFYD
jgi:hypothetical protein